MKVRNYKFDNIKGIMIFLVVLGHCVGQIAAKDTDLAWMKYIIRFIFSFHMPVFVFISGYFSSPENRNKAISRYLIPYVLANALFGLSSSLVNSQFSFSGADPFNPQWTFWYLLSLFFWKVFLSTVLEWKYPLTMMIIVALISGVFSADYYLSLSRTIAFFPYFIGGYLAGKNASISSIQEKYFNKRTSIIIFIAVEAIVLFLAYRNINALTFQLCASYRKMNQSVLAGMLLRLFTYIAGSAGILFFFSIIPNKKCYLSEMGKYSITVYLAHSFCLKFITKLIKFSSPILILSSSVLVSLLICVIFGNKRVYAAYNSFISGITRLLMKE